jgi:hypothetical protein
VSFRVERREREPLPVMMPTEPEAFNESTSKPCSVSRAGPLEPP